MVAIRPRLAPILGEDSFETQTTRHLTTGLRNRSSMPPADQPGRSDPELCIVCLASPERPPGMGTVPVRLAHEPCGRVVPARAPPRPPEHYREPCPSRLLAHSGPS